jgi:hypothetical protein
LYGQITKKWQHHQSWTRQLLVDESQFTTQKPFSSIADSSLYVFIPFSGDSAYFENEGARSIGSRNNLIAICDTFGRLRSHYTLCGTSIIQPLITPSEGFYFVSDGTMPIYSNWNKYYTPKKTQISFVILSRVNEKGHVFVLDTFFADCNIRLTGYDPVKQHFFALITKVIDYDSLRNNGLTLQKGKSTIVKFDNNGHILHQLLVDEILEELLLFDDVMLLFNKRAIIEGVTSQTHIVAISTATDELLWKVSINSSGSIHLITSEANKVYVMMCFTGHIELGGDPQGLDSAYSGMNTILFALSNKGEILWKKICTTPHILFTHMMASNGTISLLFHLNDSIDSFRWQDVEIPVEKKHLFSHRLILNSQGKPIYYYSIPNGFPNLLHMSLNPRSYLKIELESITNNTYAKSSTFGLCYRLSRIVVRDTAFYPIATQRSIQDNHLIAFPNPTNGIFGFTGFNSSRRTDAVISVYNSDGDQLITVRQPIGKRIDITPFEKGLYIIHVSLYGRVFFAKVLKE